jgi:hypothetical protein
VFLAQLISSKGNTVVTAMERFGCIYAPFTAAFAPMLLLAHEVAGRLRFISPELRADPQLASQLLSVARAVPGVTDVRIRNHTGSLIVWHDAAPATRLAVFRSLPVTASSGETRSQTLLDKLAEAATQKLLSIVARNVITALL